MIKLLEVRCIVLQYSSRIIHHALLAQVLTNQSVGAYNKEPDQLWQAMQNSCAILRFIASQTFERVEGCRAADIVMGRTEPICRLLKYLRDKFDLDYMYQQLIGDIGIELEAHDGANQLFSCH